MKNKEAVQGKVSIRKHASSSVICQAREVHRWCRAHFYVLLRAITKFQNQDSLTCTLLIESDINGFSCFPIRYDSVETKVYTLLLSLVIF